MFCATPRKAEGDTVPLLRETMTLMPVSMKGTEKSMTSDRSSLMVREPTAMWAFFKTTYIVGERAQERKRDLTEREQMKHKMCKHLQRILKVKGKLGYYTGSYVEIVTPLFFPSPFFSIHFFPFPRPLFSSGIFSFKYQRPWATQENGIQHTELIRWMYATEILPCLSLPYLN